MHEFPIAWWRPWVKALGVPAQASIGDVVEGSGALVCGSWVAESAVAAHAGRTSAAAAEGGGCGPLALGSPCGMRARHGGASQVQSRLPCAEGANITIVRGYECIRRSQ